eukprot:Skav228689  [mRNA]  locus=scaffold2247:398083:399186:- [translate_table: standard]
MAMCNIPSTITDPEYRYQMPRLMAKIEGRGNGTKTCIVNMGEVARAIRRPPQYVTKFFGNHLGAQATYTNKEGEGERSIVRGAHQVGDLRSSLDKFIEKYVCCKKCHLPEMDMYVKKGIVKGRCNACGWAGELDNTDKLAAFILRFPPEKKDNFRKEEDNFSDKKEKSEKKESKEEEVGEKPAKDPDEDEDDKGIKNLKHDEEQTKAVVGVLKEWLAGKTSPKAADFFEELRMQQLSKVFDHKVRLYIAFEALCGEAMDAKAMEGQKKLLDKVISSPKLAGADVLWALDAYLDLHDIRKGFPMLLKVAYNQDWAEEKEILKYYNEDEGKGEPGFEAAKKTAAPFLKWLAEADDDDSDEDNGDDSDSD